MMNKLYRALIHHRGYLIAAGYLLVFALAYEIAFQLRFDLNVPREMRKLFWLTLPWTAAIKLVAFYSQGSFHGWWRFVTFADLVMLLRGAVLATLLIVGVDHFLIMNQQIPRAALAIDFGVTILLVGGLRSVWRLVIEQGWQGLGGRRPVLMVGGDQWSEAMVRQIHRSTTLDYRVIGFLDENRMHHGSRLGGIPFLGYPDEAVHFATKYQVKDILVIANSLRGERLRALMEQCRREGLQLKMIPPLDSLLRNPAAVQVRDVNIDDLLGRSPVTLDNAAMECFLRGRRVLVTGAGGSIGSELCRQIARCEPERLVLLDHAENGLFFIDQELRLQFPHVKTATSVGDVADHGRLAALFRRHRPQVVFHAAAHKHVPMMEFNPGEAIKNNVLGTKCLADRAHEFRVEQFVLISTDKAVNPTSVMGATKRLAERYVQGLQDGSPCRFITVRFGNVLGSAGSVVPTFQEQIRRGGPITITHPDIERFFMTIPEACQLVLQAATMGQGGEVFVLEMGEPIKIVDLANDLIRLSGLNPEQIGIQYTGLRPGEKLSEELYFAAETTVPTNHPKLRTARSLPEELADVQDAIDGLLPVLDGPDEVIRERLRELLPEYSPRDLVDGCPGVALEKPLRRLAEFRQTARIAEQPSAT